MLRKIGSRAGMVLAFFFTACVLSEICLRVRRGFADVPMDFGQTNQMRQRLWRLWLEDRQEHPLKPPFKVFANKDDEDFQRLRLVSEHAKLPPSRSWTVPDFLQPAEKSKETAYTVTTNSLGFRGPERLSKKPAGTYRIVCLGAYQTFGLGVDDEQTYPSQLERLLNVERSTGLRYEVWNLGRPAATAIMGLALLELVVFDYEPDLIVLEYGFVDRITVDDNLMTGSMRLPEDTRLQRAIRKAARAFLVGPLGRTLLVRKALLRIWSHAHDRNMDRLQQTMRRMIRMIRQRDIPIILMDHRWSHISPRSFYEGLKGSDTGISYVSADSLLRRARPSSAQKEAFLRDYHWTQEFSPSDGRFRAEYIYQVDIFHPNSLGHELIARALAERIRGIVPARRPANAAPRPSGRKSGDD